tara:strand:+ start:4701 stop:4982 length:282 start_codon:yes stop_codon:yes gene_type:complete
MKDYIKFGFETQEEWDALSDKEKRVEAFDYYLERSLNDLGEENLLDGWYQDIADAINRNYVPDEIYDELLETIDLGHGIGKGSFTRKKFREFR